MSGRVLRLEQNIRGRDFVVGDIHGAFDLVIKAMRAAKFDQKRDRLLSVGDLIDRGPGSHRCLEFLEQPYVHAVRGNHDHDFSQLDLASLRILEGVPMLDMGWMRGVSDDKLRAISRRLAQLPIAMEVQTPRGLVGLVHADVPKGMGWQEFTAQLEAGNETVIDVALKSRGRIERNDCSGVPGVGRVFVGHTPAFAGPRNFGNVYAIDTGAVFYELSVNRPEGRRGSLTMVDVQFPTASLANVLSAAQDLRLIDERGRGPFGQSSAGPATASAVRERA